MRLLFVLFFLCYRILSFAVDYDVVVVGTSPMCMLEALYNQHLGKRVLIVEKSTVCGGAWKSIDVCGISQVDLGCHSIVADLNILSFLSDYVGCKMVSIDKPELPYDPAYSPHGFYFDKGCCEMVGNLCSLVRKTDITVLLGHKLESVYVDPEQPIATIKVGDKEFTTSKILVTPFTEISIDNYEGTQALPSHKYYHMYLLVEDPTHSRFGYHSSVGHGIMRLMNLTHFVGLEGSGSQFIVLQLTQSASQESPEVHLAEMKKHHLVDPDAKILKVDSYVYEQAQYNSKVVAQVKNADIIFEELNSSNFDYVAEYIPKWKQVLQPFSVSSNR